MCEFIKWNLKVVIKQCNAFKIKQQFLKPSTAPDDKQNVKQFFAVYKKTTMFGIQARRMLNWQLHTIDANVFI